MGRLTRQAVVFDMDGVITDSEPLYQRALDSVLAREGITLTDADVRAVIGRSILHTWRFIIRQYALAGAIENWIAEYDEAVAGELSEYATASAGLGYLLSGLQCRGVQVGLATGSRSAWAEIILDRLGVTDAFQAVATSEMVTAGKPAPDLYQLAAAKLGVAAERCIALDDTPAGIASAKAAGMFAVAVRTASTAGMDISAADRAIDSLEDFDFAWLSR